MINFQIRKMRDEIVQTINKYEIPIEVKRLVLAEIISEVSDVSMSQITKEMQEINENAKEEQAIIESEGSADVVQ